MSITRVDLGMIGSTGLVRHSGMIGEEFQPELQGQLGRRILKEMRETDPVVNAIMFAIEMLMREVPWHVNPATTDPEDQMIAQFVEECLYDMSASWNDTISEILSFLTYGWSYFEIVYKRRNGPSTDPTQRSRFTDGRIGWRKFSIRAQETLWKWAFDDEGGIQGMWQADPYTYAAPVLIPIEKSLLFRTTVTKGSPEGRSVLRGAYRPWYFKKHVENIEGIGIERDLAGLPMMEVPRSLLQTNASDVEVALRQHLEKVVQNIRRDQQEGVLVPSDRDDKGNPYFKLTLLSTGGTRQFDTDKVISRHDQRIAMVVLADFILLGHENVGSFALSSDKTALFATAIGAWMDHIKEVVTSHAIPRLLKLNGLPTDRVPEIAHGDIESVDITKIASFLQSLAAAGAPVFPNPELLRELYDIAGLPAPVEEDNSTPTTTDVIEGSTDEPDV